MQLDRVEFAKGFLLLADTFRREFSEQTLEFYYGLLSDLTFNEFQEAIKKLCLQHKELYPNSNLVALIREAAKPSEDFQLEALQAYQEASEAVREEGIYESVIFENLNIQKTIELMGGWIKFCGACGEDWNRKEFVNVYNDIRNSTLCKVIEPKVLKGIFQHRLQQSRFIKAKSEEVVEPKQLKE